MTDPLAFIIDTSVWINYFRGRHRIIGDHLDRLIDQYRIYVPGVIKAEILQGCKSEKEAKSIMGDLDKFDVVVEGPSDWVAAGWLSFRARQKGITLGLNDCLIACLASRVGCHLWSLDGDYDRITKFIKLRIYQPKLEN